MSTFLARYPGVCGGCGRAFPMGTEVAYQDDELVEVECPEVPGRDAAPGRNERSCPGCFTIHAGECV